MVFGEDVLFDELWRACAGPLVDMPREGERVYYFPQGHMEQVSWNWILNGFGFGLGFRLGYNIWVVKLMFTFSIFVNCDFCVL